MLKEARACNKRKDTECEATVQTSWKNGQIDETEKGCKKKKKKTVLSKSTTEKACKEDGVIKKADKKGRNMV